ncbi:MAG: birA, biotin-(acetyl-CoA-carboxylase) ligase [Bacteroidetes bacterium]|nr:birA, biotin-(acetyl-CoA-carboxylase) ligase [Bacteroidota bacterium]
MKTLFIGQNAVHLTAVDSTNSYASEMLRQMRPAEGTIVYSFEQKKGRGQRGSSWHGEANKNVAFSLILHPSFLHADEQFLLTKTASLAVSDLMAEMLAGQGCRVSVKWPNDVYADDKKIAGILIENSIGNQLIQSSVIGIGLNVNQDFTSEEFNAGSLKMLTGKEYDLNVVVERLCEFLEARYLQLKTNKREQLGRDYLGRLYRIDEWKNYQSSAEAFEGKIRNVSASGKLQVELRNNEIREFDLKEIVFS